MVSNGTMVIFQMTLLMNNNIPPHLLVVHEQFLRARATFRVETDLAGESHWLLQLVLVLTIRRWLAPVSADGLH